MSPREKGRLALKQPLQSKQTWDGTPYLRLVRTSDPLVREQILPTPTVIPRSRLDLLVVLRHYEVSSRILATKIDCISTFFNLTLVYVTGFWIFLAPSKSR
ncbi:hypothetical protein J6590_081346 [Homalodisca vitripennis]|nr:hypothetical protein J6590_081346 [Homalodisca vitripennis]